MINFPFGTNGKLMVFGVQKLKHITVLVIITKYSRTYSRDAGE